MPSLFDPDARAALVARLQRLTPDTQPTWGRLSARQMVAHVNDALRMGTGELATAPVGGPLRYPPLKQLIIYLLPFPRSTPTAPELLARQPGEWAAEQADFAALIGVIGTREGATAWPDHPAFGRMSARDWGVLGWRHVDHHWRQFTI